MRAITTVVWDWNGTLLDDVQLSLDIANEILGEHEIAALSVERYREIFQIPVSAYWERAGMHWQRVPFDSVSREFCTRFERRVHRTDLFPDARSALRTLDERGIDQFLLSATEHQSLTRMMGTFRLDEAFRRVQGMDNTLAIGKLEGARRLLADGGINPGTTVFVGDTTHDAEIASALGAACILVSTGHQSRHRLDATNRPVVDSFDELLALLA